MAKFAIALVLWSDVTWQVHPIESCGFAPHEQETAMLQKRVRLSKKEEPAPHKVADPTFTETGTSNTQGDCHTLLEGEPCYKDVHWAMMEGIFNYPQFYPPPLSTASSFEEFQAHMNTLNPVLCPKPCPISAVKPYSEPCSSHTAAWTLKDSHPHINLGGLGPDAGAANMRYHRVGSVKKETGAQPKAFDLVVEATGPYQFNRQNRNGLAGSYGIVNLKSKTKANLQFRFEDSESGEPVKLEAFHFSLFDLDHSGGTQERATVHNFTRYVLDPETEVLTSGVSDNTATFESTQRGAGCDNPADPLKLGIVTCKGRVVNQRKRSVSFLFEGVSSFKIDLEVTGKRKRCWATGRNFLFAGSSSLMKTCSEVVELGLCAAFGDPHFVTFDGAHTVLMSHQTIWLVRSQEVWIQAESVDGDGKFQGLAIGGEFMGFQSLVVRKVHASSLQVTLNGESILTQPESEFHIDGFVRAYRRTTWNATLHNSEVLGVRTQMQFAVGPWPERFLKQPIGGLVLLRLPGDIEVTVTGVDFMTTVITMPAAIAGQGGYCGNFNGNSQDDFEAVSASFHRPVGKDLEAVNPEESLFGSEESVSLIHAQKHRLLALDPDSVLRNCDQSVLQMAQERCKQVSKMDMNRDCVFDVCATGLISAADGILAAELLETKVNSRGIPLFVGNGQCLDAVARHYTTYATKLTEENECKDILRGLAVTAGVMGAQMQSGGNCEVVVDSRIEPLTTRIRGGWVVNGSKEGFGHGIISGTTDDATWICWQLV